MQFLIQFANSQYAIHWTVCMRSLEVGDPVRCPFTGDLWTTVRSLDSEGQARLPLDYGIHKFRWSLQCLHKVSNYKVSSIAPYNRSLFNGFKTKQLSLCVSSQKQTTSNAAGHGFGTIFPSLIPGKFKGHTAPSPLDCHFLTRVLGPVRWCLLCSLF